MSVTTRECQSMRLLARDGWSAGELKMTMQVCRTDTVRHHVIGQCAHTHGTQPLVSWDGYSAPERLTAEDRGAEADA